MQTLGWFGAAGLLFGSFALIGLAVAGLVHRKDMSPGEDVMVAGGGAIGVTAIAAVAQLPLSVPYTTVSPALMLVLLIASAVILWRRRQWLGSLWQDAQVRVIALSFGGLFVLALALAALPWDKPYVHAFGTVGSFHVPNMPGDTLLQYRTAQVLQNRLDIQTTDFYLNYWFISDRTPLVGLVTTFLSASAGIQLPASLDALNSPYQLIDPYGYWLYRQISIFTNALAVSSAVMVAWQLLGRRAAVLGSVFFILSPYVMVNLLFHWPKLLVGFFVVGFYFWSYVKPRPVLAGVFAAGGVLSHPLGALFLPGMFVYVVLSRRWRQLLVTAVAAAAVASPWFFWTTFVYRHSSRMLTYPIGFALNDPTNPGPEIRAGLQTFIHRPLGSILMDRWITVWNTFTSWPYPVQLLATRSWHGLALPTYETLRASFPGMFGAGLAIFGYLSLKQVVTRAFWFWTLGASVICIVLFWGFEPRAIAIDTLEPATALWCCLAASVLLRAPRWVIRAAVAVSAAVWIPFTYGLLLATPRPSGWTLAAAAAVAISLAIVGATTLLGWRLGSPPQTVKTHQQVPVQPLPATSVG